MSVPVVPEAEEAVAELLGGLLGQAPAICTDARTGRTVVSVYLVGRADRVAGQKAAVRAGLRRIQACHLPQLSTRVTLTSLRVENWAESWKRHFKPIDIGSALLIKPSWSRRRPARGQALVVLDPGMSFGTGQHPTTAFCLEQIVARRAAARLSSLLDVGTGSGILAIAAAKLGYHPVEAFDADPAAVRVAQANARRNRLAPKIRFCRRDLTRLPFQPRRRFDVVCANLVWDLLLAERDRLVNLVAAGGTLVLAGILRSQFLVVRQAYEAAGLRLIASQTANEWRSVSLGVSSH